MDDRLLMSFIGVDLVSHVANKIGGNVNRMASTVEGAGSRVGKAWGAMVGVLKAAAVVGIAAVAAVGAGLVTMGERALSAANSAYELGQQMSLPASKAAQWQSVLRQTNVEVDAFSVAMKMMAKRMVDSPKEFEKFHIGITDSHGKLLNLNDAMLATLSRISKLQGAAKTAALVDIFGRSGLSMMPLVEQGPKGIAAMMASGTQVSDDQAEAAHRLTLQWAAFQEQLGKIGMGIGLMVLPSFSMLLGFLNTTALPALQKFGAWLNGVLAPIFGIVGDSVSNFAMAIHNGLGPLGVINAVIAPLIGKSGLGGLGDAIDILEMGVAGLVRWFQQLAPIVGSLLVAAFRAVAPTVMTFVAAVIQLIPPAQKLVMDVLQVAVPLFLALWKAIQPVVVALIDLAKNVLTILIDVAKKVFENLKPLIKQLLPEWQKLMKALAPAIKAVSDFLKDHRQQIEDVVTWVLTFAGSTVLGILITNIKVATTVIGKIVDVTKTLVGWFQSAVDWAKKVADAVSHIKGPSINLPAGLKVPGLDEGGFILRDTLAMVHAGEYVLPKNAVSAIVGKQAFTPAALNPSRSSTVNNNSKSLQGVTINVIGAHDPKATADAVLAELVAQFGY